MAQRTKKRGRKSVASKTLAVIDGGALAPPKPPGKLTSEALDVWHEVVKTEPHDFFQTEVAQAMLADYCQHRVTADLLTAQISEFDPEWLKMDEGTARLDRLLRMRDRETTAGVRIATKLRLTNQARYTPKASATRARNRVKVARPWEM